MRKSGAGGMDSRPKNYCGYNNMGRLWSIPSGSYFCALARTEDQLLADLRICGGDNHIFYADIGASVRITACY